MKPRHARPRTGGFTGWDLLVVVVVLGLLAALLLPALARSRSRPKRINCISNVKQIGLAFRMWSNDHGEKFPMQLSALSTNRGTMEYNLTGQIWRHFAALSNELSSPKVLTCMSDPRERLVTWSGLTDNTHLSYFVGLDADETRPQTILSGDCNLTSSVPSTNGVLFLRSGDTIEWTTALHNRMGNFGLGDGSAQQMNSPAAANKQLEAALLSTSQLVHRLALPQ